MSELAYNLSGEPFTPSPKATHWRGKRMKAKGAPEVIYKDGRPLITPIDIDYETFRNAVGGAPGRYRLDPVDEIGRPVEGPPAYVQVDEPEPEPRAAAPDVREDVVSQLLRAQTEQMKAQSEMLTKVIESNVEMMRAAAELVRAADAAGMPNRQPPPPVPPPEPEYIYVDDAEDKGKDEPDAQPVPASIDWISKLPQLMQLVPIMCAKGGPLDQLGGLFNRFRGKTTPPVEPARDESARRETPARKAQPTRPRAQASTSAPTPAAAGEPSATPSPASERNATPASQPTGSGDAANASPIADQDAAGTSSAPADDRDLDRADGFEDSPNEYESGNDLESGEDGEEGNEESESDGMPPGVPPQLAHMLAIQAQLTPRERVIVDVLLSELSDDERLVYGGQLMCLRVDDAVATIRAQLKQNNMH